MLDQVLFHDLASRLREKLRGQVLLDVHLSDFSRWRIGGKVPLLILPACKEDILFALALIDEIPCPKIVIGDGSNLLFDSAGLNGIVIRIGPPFSHLRIEDTNVWAEAGIWVPNFVKAVGLAGLTGIEHAIGIPGTLGGLVLMNGGSQRKGIGEHLVSVSTVDMHGTVNQIPKAACEFSYRHSSLQAQQLIILEANFSFQRDNVERIRREMIEIMASRRAKFPKNYPNCGSVFLSDPKMYDVVGPPGLAIEKVGLKGERQGGAQISPLHANFIINLGNARSSDVLWLIHLMRNRVFEETGFKMDCEVRHVSPEGVMRSAHVAAEICFGETTVSGRGNVKDA